MARRPNRGSDTASAERLTIGALAEQGGVGVETVRYYQRRGLLPQPPRPPGGVRRYPAALAERIRFIKRAQGIGFSLEDVRGLLEHGDADCEYARGLAEAKLAEVEQIIADLHAISARLRGLVADCRTRPAEVGCPLVDKLRLANAAEGPAPAGVPRAGGGRGIQ